MLRLTPARRGMRMWNAAVRAAVCNVQTWSSPGVARQPDWLHGQMPPLRRRQIRRHALMRTIAADTDY